MKQLLFSLSLLALTLTACKKDDTPEPEILTAGPDQIVFALSANNELIKLNAKTPGTNISKTAVTGIVSGEKLISIDFRPATGELYALSNASKLYIVNTTTTAARVVGSAAFAPAISGTIAAIDFNPTVDRVRLVTNSGQNLRLNPETGTVAATDANLNGPASPMVTAIAYTNSKAGAATTTLFNIDAVAGKLYKQEPPNNGTLVEIGSLGATSNTQAGFEIMANNTALATIGNNFYSIDVATGKASKIGNTSETFIDIAIPAGLNINKLLARSTP